MINVGHSEFRQAFHAHLKAAQKTEGCCSYLLLFYAVECGFKSMWLKEKKIFNTDKIQNDHDMKLFTEEGHNLAVWIKKLGLEPYELTKIGLSSDLKEIKYFRLQNKSSYEVGNAHQAWRYHVRLDADDEKKLVEVLKNICDLIKEKINQ